MKKSIISSLILSLLCASEPSYAMLRRTIKPTLLANVAARYVGQNNTYNPYKFLGLTKQANFSQAQALQSTPLTVFKELNLTDSNNYEQKENNQQTHDSKQQIPKFNRWTIPFVGTCLALKKLQNKEASQYYTPQLSSLPIKFVNLQAHEHSLEYFQKQYTTPHNDTPHKPKNPQEYSCHNFNPNDAHQYNQILMLTKQYQHYLYDPNEPAEQALAEYKQALLKNDIPKLKNLRIKVLAPEKDPTTIAAVIVYQYPHGKGNMIGIRNIVTNPKYQRQGLATHLLEHVEQEAIKRNLGICAAIYSTNTACLNLFKQKGAQIIHAEKPTLLSNGEIAQTLVFVKKVSE